MNRWLALAPLVVLAALAALFIGWSLKRDPVIKPDAMVGQPVPASSLPRLDEAAAADIRTLAAGRPVLVNLFASWCAPCRIEHPKLMELKARGVVVIGVAYKDEPVATRAFLEEMGDPFDAVLVDREDGWAWTSASRGCRRHSRWTRPAASAPNRPAPCWTTATSCA